MTTEPGTPQRPTASTGRPVQGPTNRQSSARVVTVSSPGPLIGAMLTVFLGIALGIANQAADGTAMALRVPALLAALMMVAQGVLDIKRHVPRRRIVEETDSLVLEEGSGQGARATELAVVRQLPPPQAITPVVVRPTPVNMAVPITVMLLAAWLGLADLRVESPPSLTVLSLIAAFALFALGWSLLPARR